MFSAKAVNQTLVYWPKEAFMCFEEYDNLDIPFSDVTKLVKDYPKMEL